MAEENIKSIAAIATPMGMGGIAVVRISGTDAFEIASKMLTERDGMPLDREKQTDRLMRLVSLNACGVRDRVMCVFFVAPHSYTGENVAEIHTHGNLEIAAAAVRAAIQNGARQAEAGEFTRRAFLNGKMDLTAAEGIADLIEAQGEAQLSAAYAQSEGALQSEIDKVYTALIELAAQAEAAIDYPEEDIEETTQQQIAEQLQKIRETLNLHLEGYREGALIRDGVRVVLAGDPNVGKSKLMNALLGQERAIVTAVAGTTRDTIEDGFVYEGVKFVLCDTAGIRETEDDVEKLGVQRSRRALESADLILAVSAAGTPFSVPLPQGKRVIYVENKIDLLPQDKTVEGEKNEAQEKDASGMKVKKNGECAEEKKENEKNKQIFEESEKVSALTGKNIERLKKRMRNEVKGGITGGGARLNNLRQYQAACEAQEICARAAAAVGVLPMDCIASDLTAAASALGKITGKTASEEIISTIFARFCVGK